MHYRELGKTGVKVSVLGMGGMRYPERCENGHWTINEDLALPLIKKSYELGVNYYDSAPYYNNSNSHKILAKGLKGFRENINLATKLPLGDLSCTEDYRKLLEKYLTELDTAYIDFYHFWSLDKSSFENKVLKFDLIKEALKAKDDGLIRHIAFSVHDSPENVKYILDAAPELETMLIQYNLLDRSNEDVIAYAVSKGVGVVAMGPVGGGRLAAPAGLYKKLTGRDSDATYELALRFVMGNTNISCALAGFSEMEMLEKDAQIANSGAYMTEQEWAQAGRAMEEVKKFSDLYCTGCRYCSGCPQNIDIARVFDIYTKYNVYNLNSLAKDEYTGYLKDENAGKIEACIECGLCEGKCPQKLKIIENLKKADEILKRL